MKPHSNMDWRKIFTIPLFVNEVASLHGDRIHVYFRVMLLKVRTVIALFILMSATSAYSQSPELRCLSVDAVGNVQLSWMPPSGICGVFNQYYIYYSPTISGPFILIDSIGNIATTNYTHIGGGASLSSNWYYVEANTGCVNTISDTLETMFLSVNNSFTGTANLQWNSLHSPAVPTSTNMYLIYREDTVTGILQLVDSISQLVAFTDSYTSCGQDSTAYQVGLLDSSGCLSLSNIALLEPDDISPGPVTIDSASLDIATGQVILGWQASSSIDVVAYVITVYNTTNDGYDDIDTVYGTNSYFDLLGNLSNTDSIFVYALDMCGNRGVLAANGHSTIKLTGEVDTCRGIATLNWTPYYIWSTGISGYDIYISQNGGPFVYEGTANGTQYVYSGLIRGTSYCYFVRANDGLGTKTSSSNVMCTYADTSSDGPEPFVLFVEARDSVKNRLQWSEDASWSSSLIAQYDIYRSFDGGSYSLIGSAPFGTTTYEDMLEPLSNFISGEGVFCYFVVPIKVSTSLYGCVNSSDTICVTQFPKFVVANTFTPNGDGRNDIFLPVQSFVRVTGYLLTIYSRWGQKLFETTDVTQGWDGYVNGTPAQNEAFVYYVTFVIKDGIPVTRAGTVLLIR